MASQVLGSPNPLFDVSADICSFGKSLHTSVILIYELILSMTLYVGILCDLAVVVSFQRGFICLILPGNKAWEHF